MQKKFTSSFSIWQENCKSFNINMKKKSGNIKSVGFCGDTHLESIMTVVEWSTSFNFFKEREFPLNFSKYELNL